MISVGLARAGESVWQVTSLSCRRRTASIVFSPDQYELLDFGRGRKLERFGRLVLDRPAPVASQFERRDPSIWKSADARFHRTHAGAGRWLSTDCRSGIEVTAETWNLRHEGAVFELRCTQSGAIGVYPEQAVNWSWMAKQIRQAERRLKILNLFAYTGGSTLAAAAAGAEVVHVDAARGVVSWAQRCAKLSKLQDAPIRWITEDAVKFAQRELKRGVQYDGVILDPPTYGHGPKGERWQIEKELRPLLRICAQLTEKSRAFVLLTCHASSLESSELEAMLADAMFGQCRSNTQTKIQAKPLMLHSADSRQLPSGLVARWPCR